MIGSDHLTATPLAHRETAPGQAHFALAGEERTCRECENWTNHKGERDRVGNLKPASHAAALALIFNASRQRLR